MVLWWILMFGFFVGILQVEGYFVKENELVIMVIKNVNVICFLDYLFKKELQIGK